MTCLLALGWRAGSFDRSRKFNVLALHTSTPLMKQSLNIRLCVRYMLIKHPHCRRLRERYVLYQTAVQRTSSYTSCTLSNNCSTYSFTYVVLLAAHSHYTHLRERYILSPTGALHECTLCAQSNTCNTHDDMYVVLNQIPLITVSLDITSY